uniref:Anoctaminlike protein putative n=1 Tax=Albugo laibachii Nc14 TaxID=890382 RepID=F0WMI4_9STRA|nr:anoctaminlike protein putative [Albugo laibachii Nc14]|eukprot:CCA22516.1 anoctaminlike protein putative [Albugo laibachii Nc14]
MRQTYCDGDPYKIDIVFVFVSERLTSEYLRMDLLEACENGNEERVLAILLYGPAFEEFDPSQPLRPPSSDILIRKGVAGRTPLHAACIGGQMHIVRLLLGDMCDVFFPSYSMEQTIAFLSPFAFLTNLHNALSVKKLFQLRLSLHDNVFVPLATLRLPECYCVPSDTLMDTEMLDMFGNTPLQCISCSGCGSTNQHIEDGIEITKQLLWYGDQPNVPKYTNGWTPLHWSAFHGNHEQALLLLNPKAHIDLRPNPLGMSQQSIPLLRDVDGMYPVDIAGRRAISLQKELRCLRRKRRQTGVHQLTETECWRLRLDPVRVIDVLASDFIENATQWAPYANDMGSRLPHEILRRNRHYRKLYGSILRDGFTCTDILRYGQHLLYWSACFGMTRHVSALLRMRFEVRKRNWMKYKTGNLASHVIGNDIQPIIVVCISPLHTCSCEQNKGQSALHIAAERGKREIVQSLLNRIITNQKEATRNRKKNAIAPQRKRDFDGDNARAPAIQMHTLHSLGYLEKGWLNNNRDSPLFLATMARQFSTIQLLTNTLSALSLAWELEHCNRDGLSLLQMAREPILSSFLCPPTNTGKEHVEVLKILEHSKASLSSLSRENSEPKETQGEVTKVLEHSGTPLPSLPRESTENSSKQVEVSHVLQHSKRSLPSLSREVVNAQVEVSHDLEHSRSSVPSLSKETAEIVLIFHSNFNFKSCLMDTLRESSIQSPSLIVIPMKSNSTESSMWTSSLYKEYVAVGATENVLQQHTETLQLNVKHLNSKKRSHFIRAQKHNFQPFPSLQRQQIVFDIMKIDVHVEKHLRNRNIYKLFPLHDVFGIESIFRHWVSSDSFKRKAPFWSKAIYQPFSGTTVREMLLENRSFSYDFLWPLANYFGEKHAFYYAFVVFYTVWLVFIAIPGAMCQFLRTVFHIHWLEPLFAVLVSVWATLVVEFWKRKRSELGVHFGNVQRNRKELVSDYYGDFQVSDVSLGTVDITFPRKIQLFRMYCGLPVLVFMAVLVVIVFLCTQSGVVDQALHCWLKRIPYVGTVYVVPFCNAVCMMILDAIYTKVAIALTRWENHQTVWQRESVLATKLFWFKFLNAFLSLFYVAFVRQSASDLRNQLIIIIGVRQLWYLWERMLWPILLVRLKWRLAGFHIPTESFLVAKWYLIDKSPTYKDNEPVPVTVILQEAMRQPDLLLNKQMEIILQFGYITMFVSVLPLGPLLALGINVLTLRLDVLSCLQAKQRPLFDSEAEITTFMSILEFMSFAAVAINCALLYSTCHIDFDASMRRIWRSVYEDEDKVWMHRMGILVVVEHVVLGMKALLALMIDDSARWVRHEQSTKHFDVEAVDELEECEEGEDSAMQVNG